MRKHSRFAVIASLAVPLVASLASTAYAQPHEPQRVFGIGSAFGAGVMAAGLIGLGSRNTTQTSILPAIELPSLEFSYFLPNDWAIDLTVPLTNMIIVGATAHAFYFNTDAFLNFNLGKGSIRGVLGPGIGFDILTTSSSSGSTPLVGIRVLGEAGFEALSTGRNFGFKLLARPFVEFVPTGGVSAIGGGSLFLLDFMGYYTR